MKCANCRKPVTEHEAWDFGGFVVCKSCLRDLLYMTRETGGDITVEEELAYEVSVDEHIGAWA